MNISNAAWSMIFLFPSSVIAMPLSARSLAMGDVRPWEEGLAHAQNPSLRFFLLPYRTVFPVPLGWMALSAFPTTDIEDDRFDASDLWDAATPFPFHLELADTPPAQFSSLNAWVYEDSLRIALNDVADWLSDDAGSWGMAQPLFTAAWNVSNIPLRSTTTLFLDLRDEHAAIRDALNGVTLALGDSVSGSFGADGALVSSIGGEWGHHFNQNGPINFAMGFRPKLLLGWAAMRSAGSYSFETGEEQIFEQGRSAVDMQWEEAYPSRPAALPGVGLALDAGATIAFDAPWIVGIGAEDLFSAIRWSRVVHASKWDSETEAFETNERGTSAAWEHVPRRWSASVFGWPFFSSDAWSGKLRPLQLIGEWFGINDRMEGRVGSELRLGRIAPRMGLKWTPSISPSIGAGVMVGPIECSLAISHRVASPFYRSSTLLGFSVDWIHPQKGEK